MTGGDADPHGPWLLLMRLCHAPLLAWGPLTAAVVAAYHRRHRLPPHPSEGARLSGRGHG